jgi:hypothetical protein
VLVNGTSLVLVTSSGFAPLNYTARRSCDTVLVLIDDTSLVLVKLYRLSVLRYWVCPINTVRNKQS